MNSLEPPGASAGREEEIRARCEKATAGPWRVREKDNPLNDVGRATFPKGIVEEPARWIVTEWDHPQLEGPESIIMLGHSPFLRDAVCPRINPEDAAFIAHARADVPWLLAQLAESRSALAAERAAGEAAATRIRELEAKIGQPDTDWAWDSDDVA